ncbi:MAG: hypothetical protein H7A23_26010 [Leptospiraceae bacterium]|nr:hypothetical protein [Leptospiraceae bacterium]MCP5498025.1 hypothetical protein [Leptospiraceae bacterium]
MDTLFCNSVSIQKIHIPKQMQNYCSHFADEQSKKYGFRAIRTIFCGCPFINIMDNIDQDSPWKEILEIYFSEFVEFFLPELFIEIDWNLKPVFLDKEFQKLTGDIKGT